MKSEEDIATYIMASGRNGTLYTGCTSELWQRVLQHKQKVFEGFSAKYGCTRLVWYERHGLMTRAIRRERLIKHWRRDWKLALIEELNPQWRCLAEDWYGDEIPSAGSSGSLFERPEDDE